MLNRTALRIALARTGKTLKQVAQEAGIDLLRLYRITSKNVRPRPEELGAVAECLGLDSSELQDDGGDSRL
jgi:DNA-binding phage protein